MARIARVMLVVAGVALFMMSKSGNPVATELRTTILDTVTPVVEVVSSPINAMSDFAGWVSGLVTIRSENIALKNQNAQLLQWQAMAKRMESENQSLKKLLNFVPAKKYGYVTVHMVSDISGPFAQSALINGGKEQNIKLNQAVIDENGLLGRVVEVGNSSARVLLITDINSRLPVMSERTREKSILIGNNKTLPSLSYMVANSALQVGDRLVTSGDGGMFPSGVPVGVVSAINGTSVTVQPFADISRAEYVSAIDYSF